MDEIPAEEFAPVSKFRFATSGRSQIMSLVFAAAITFVILVTVYATSYIQQTQQKPASVSTIEQATWSISRIEPAPGSTTDVNLTLTSSIGNIRNYAGVRSYGLSNNRQMLVTSNATALTLINLADDTHTKLKPPFDYAGDQGQAISWTSDDNFFGMAVYKGQTTKDTHVVIYTADGSAYKDYSGMFTSHVSNSNTIVYPIKFDTGRNLFLARTYKAEDVDYYKSQNLTIDQLPVILRAYNLEGVVVKDISVRDAAPIPTSVYYFWDKTGKYLTYLVAPSNVEINFADEAQFTKLAV